LSKWCGWEWISRLISGDGTDYCIGFQTAINRAGEFINRIRSTAGSHRETVLFRLFGRDAGFTALETAIVSWADRLLIPEVSVDIDILAELIVQDPWCDGGTSRWRFYLYGYPWEGLSCAAYGSC
jgi:Phosphofructokinase